VSITFITSERTLGDMGFGQTAAGPVLAEIFNERGIPYRTGITIAGIERGQLTLGNGDVIPAEAAFIMPPFTGASDIWKSSGLTDSTGLIPVNRSYQHVKYPGIYAAGVASYFLHPVQPLAQQRAPHTGYLSLRMGVIAAENVAASLGHGEEAGRTLPELIDLRVLDGGDDGVLISSRGSTELHNSARRLPGAVAHRAKESIERYLVWKLRTGHVTSFQVPAIERV
jgi:sulfide:quinone oxidoreductase